MYFAPGTERLFPREAADLPAEASGEGGAAKNSDRIYRIHKIFSEPPMDWDGLGAAELQPKKEE